jgi:hypothetical protein
MTGDALVVLLSNHRAAGLLMVGTFHAAVEAFLRLPYTSCPTFEISGWLLKV